MKKLLILLFMMMSLVFVSCSSNEVNEVKLDVASKIKVSVKKELVKAFAGIEIEGVDCNLEAEIHSEYIYDKVKEMLQVKKSMNKSLMSPKIVACNFVVKEGFPFLMSRVGGSSACLKKLGTEKLMEVGSEICKKL